MRKELTIEERLDMIEECNRKTNYFLKHATDEDIESLFSVCAKVENLEGLFSGLPKSYSVPKIEM